MIIKATEYLEKQEYPNTFELYLIDNQLENLYKELEKEKQQSPNIKI